MCETSKTEVLSGSAFDVSMTADHWWRDGGQLLPGEQGAVTVFEIRFWDGCRHLGHTDMTVSECVDGLVASPWDERRSVFVAEHAARMGSVVRVVASNLTAIAAAELRDELVRTAPEGVQNVDGSALEARECFLSEVPAEPLRMTFAEWMKTEKNRSLRGPPRYDPPVMGINGAVGSSTDGSGPAFRSRGKPALFSCAGFFFCRSGHRAPHRPGQGARVNSPCGRCRWSLPVLASRWESGSVSRK